MFSRPRFYCPAPLLAGATISLPAGAARHVQVLRLQPGDGITLFGAHAAGEHRAPDQATSAGSGGEFEATIAEMGRHEVTVVVGRHDPVERESVRALQLAVGMPANERMDWLVEKATEMGVASIQPLMSERSVVRLDDQRAKKKTVHWGSIAIAACEQCGRNRVPVVQRVRSLNGWATELGAAGTGGGARFVLTFRPGALSLRQTIDDGRVPQGLVTVLSGPEGGLSVAEEELALAQGFQPVSLGARVLRSETAAMVALALLA